MRPRSLLMLLAAVLAVGAFIWFFERDLPSTDERLELAKKVSGLAAEDVTAVEIDRAGVSMRIERASVAAASQGDEPTSAGAASWLLVRPFGARADAEAVDGLISSLVDLDKNRTLEDANRVNVGLETPRARITLVAGALTEVLEIGGEIPASQEMVVGRPGEDEFFVVASSLWGALDKEPGEWRSRDVLTAESEQIERLALRSGGEPIVLERRGETFWLTSPMEDAADGERLTELLTALTDLEATTFVDEPQNTVAMGLESPGQSVEVTLTGVEAPFLLELGEVVPDGEAARFARAGGQVFTFQDEALRQALDRPSGDWQSRSWTELAVYQVDKVTVRRGDGEQVELERSGSDWLRSGDKIAYTSVSDFLYALTGAEALAVEGRRGAVSAGLSLDVPELEIEVSGAGGSESLALHAVTERGVAATSSGRSSILYLPPATAADIQLKLEEIESAESLDDRQDLPEAESG